MKRKIFNYCGYAIGLIAAVALYYVRTSRVFEYPFHDFWFGVFVNVFYSIVVPLGSAVMVLLVVNDYKKDREEERRVCTDIEVQTSHEKPTLDVIKPRKRKKRRHHKPKQRTSTDFIHLIDSDIHGE